MNNTKPFKTPLSEGSRKFDLKFLLVGDSGVGKSHFCATYTKGPVHFYMLDPGGEKTLYKFISHREANNLPPITLDKFPLGQADYNDFWKQVQEDDKSGFFDYMAQENGLLVFPDSLSSASNMVLGKIANLNQKDLLTNDPKKQMTKREWGQCTAWLFALLEVVNSLPCAVASIAHIHTDTDNNGTPNGRYPYVVGQERYRMGRLFDEVYHMDMSGKNYDIYFKEHALLKGKSRVFAPVKVRNITMDIIHDAYMSGDDLSKLEKGGDKEQKTNEAQNKVATIPTPSSKQTN